MDQGLKIVVSADVQQVAAGMQQATQTIQDMEKELNLLGRAIDTALSKGEDIAPLEAAFDSLNNKIKQLKATASTAAPTQAISGIGQQLNSLEAPIADAKSGFAGLGLSLTQSRVAFTDLGRIVTGQGFSLRSLAANFSLLGPGITIAVAALYGLYELLNKQTDAEKKAADEAKHLAETLKNLKSVNDITESATGSEQGNIARVQALAAVIMDTNNAYKQRQTALNELRETNKSYFGDLSLEADSLKQLADRVNTYSQALITEAIIKGQVEEIANLSRELQKQTPILKQNADAVDAQREANDKLVSASVGKNDFGAGGGGSSKVLDAENQLSALTAQYLKQNDVVATLQDQINRYTDSLNQNIQEQAKQRPLSIPKGEDDLDKIKAIRKEIAGLYADIAKPDTRPNFLKFNDAQDGSPILKSIDAEIASVRKKFTEAANDPALQHAYSDLIVALQAKETKIQNPNYKIPINYTLADPSKNEQTEIETKLEKAFGSKGLELKVPVHLSEDIEQGGNFTPGDVKKIQEGLQKDVGLAKFYVSASLQVKIALGKNLINQADIKKLKETIDKTVSDVAASGFKDIGVVLGDALSGAKNPLQKAIQDFTTVLGNGLIKIGEQMIAASVLMQALQASLGSLFANPAASLVEGVAAVALGEVVKNVGAHAFATGGIVTGPTFGLVGEAGPEVIFPLDRLNRFIKANTGSGPQNIVVTGRISGRDIAITQKRDSKLQNLTS